ncbi:MAG TPA: hypothetical protein VN767_30235 [Streptosporangiaceae bacterium]|jgi:hypothetical protein|nr:hypothetical protein [Streptosporangiaceae bacterium]
MSDELVSRVTDYAGAAMFDRYVVAAVEQRLRLDQLDDPSADMVPM